MIHIKLKYLVFEFKSSGTAEYKLDNDPYQAMVLVHSLLIKSEDHHLCVEVWTVLHPVKEVWLVAVARQKQVQLSEQVFLQHYAP